MNQQVDINRILQILGAKEVEITILRERIQQLEAYVKNSEEKNSAESETVECE